MQTYSLEKAMTKSSSSRRPSAPRQRYTLSLYALAAVWVWAPPPKLMLVTSDPFSTHPSTAVNAPWSTWKLPLLISGSTFVIPPLLPPTAPTVPAQWVPQLAHQHPTFHDLFDHQKLPHGVISPVPHHDHAMAKMLVHP